MSARFSPPLPECELCERPTARSVHEANGGLCTECATGLADTVRMLLPMGRGVADIDAARRRRLQRQGETLDDSTVYVERYIPPVPGQLEIDDTWYQDGDEGQW